MKNCAVFLFILVFTWSSAQAQQSSHAQSVQGPRSQGQTHLVRFDLPPELGKEYDFLGQKLRLDRPDLRSRLISQVNFLLYDARSVLTEWLLEKTRSNWILRETFSKNGVPEDFIWLAPVMAGAARSSKPQGVGAWLLDKPCSAIEGVEMRDNSFMDDRLDIQLSTKCFAHRISSLHNDYNFNWFMATVAYLLSPKTTTEIIDKYGTSNPWDIPLPKNIEDMLDRWIALKIIYTNRQYYGLEFKDPAPFIFDQLSDVRLSKDLPVAEIAKILSVSPRLILEINPKIKTTPGIFPAKADGKQLTHTIAAPSGKGVLLLKKLEELGYVEGFRKL